MREASFFSHLITFLNSGQNIRRSKNEFSLLYINLNDQPKIFLKVIKELEILAPSLPLNVDIAELKAV